MKVVLSARTSAGHSKQHAGKARREEMSHPRQHFPKGSNYPSTYDWPFLISWVSAYKPALSQDLKLHYNSQLKEIPWLRLKEIAFFFPLK